ncbi:MAG: hypothetical protein ACREFC_07740, partial [Stellaceae bacterium]
MKFTTVAAVLFGVCFFAIASHAAYQKVIKDPAEYNAYMHALNTADPSQKASQMEQFVAAYPDSVVKLDALEQTMAAYQQAGDTAKVEATARRILTFDAGHVRALSVVTYLERGRATQGDAKALAALRTDATRGLREIIKWRAPDGMNQAEYLKLRDQMLAIFSGAAGFVALQDKNYGAARGFYQKAVKLAPEDLQEVYQLGVAELQMSPLDPNGFWYVARAMHLAGEAKNQAAVQSIGDYGRAKYKRYHGSEDGWDRIVASAAKAAKLPPNFAKTLKASSADAEVAVKAVHDNDPASLSFS